MINFVHFVHFVHFVFLKNRGRGLNDSFCSICLFHE